MSEGSSSLSARRVLFLLVSFAFSLDASVACDLLPGSDSDFGIYWWRREGEWTGSRDWARVLVGGRRRTDLPMEWNGRLAVFNKHERQREALKRCEFLLSHPRRDSLLELTVFPARFAVVVA